MSVADDRWDERETWERAEDEVKELRAEVDRLRAQGREPR